MTSLPRIVLALAVVVLMARAGRVAWSRRDLALDVWRSVRLRHVAGGVALVLVILTVTVSAVELVPWLGFGLGDLFGTSGGNAVFAPVDVAGEAVTPDGQLDGGDVLYLAVVTVFLALLAALLPWFAFVEEEVFRAGAEAWSVGRRVAAAAVFGAAHLVMLIPLGAAIGLTVAGLVYGEVYRRGVRTGGPPPPRSLARAFRHTRRSRAALAAALGGADAEHDPLAAARHVERQVAGIHRAAVLHTAANTVVVVLVWTTMVLDVLLP